MSAGIANVPAPEVTVLKVSPVLEFVTTTVAPGITSPPLSTTTPEIEAVDEPCANTPVAVNVARRTAAAARIHPEVIANPLERGSEGSEHADRTRAMTIGQARQAVRPCNAPPFVPEKCEADVVIS